MKNVITLADHRKDALTASEIDLITGDYSSHEIGDLVTCKVIDIDDHREWWQMDWMSILNRSGCGGR